MIFVNSIFCLLGFMRKMQIVSRFFTFVGYAFSLKDMKDFPCFKRY